MDINQLNCFIAVAQTLNFSEAARRTYVSQSTVSRYISDLEKEFGVQLFTRSHRDVIITNEGKTLLPYAVEIVDTLNKAKLVVKQIHEGGKGRITIGCDVSSLAFPSKCIADFKEHYPGITVEIKQLRDADFNNAITGGEYDFCFMPRDMVPGNSEIDSIVTHYESLAIVVSKNHKFADRKSISFSELTDEKLLLLSEAVCPIIFMEIMDILHTFHISPNIEHTFEDVVSLYIASNSGLGVSIIPSSLSTVTSEEIVSNIPIEDADTNIAYCMAWSKGFVTPAAKLFIESVKKFAQGEDDEYEI